MDTRTRILRAAADLLSRSTDADVSTRAVCEAAGVGAPILYRQFGDKAGLLSAVVDYGFEQYLAPKRAAVPSADPVQDLRNGWDHHVRFAVENPNYYRLMYSPGLSVPPEAAAEAQRLLRGVVERVAAAGRLRVAPETATRMVMSANSGVALSLIARPALYPDPAFSDRVRDAVIGAVTLTPDPVAAATVATTAAMLGSQLRAAPPAALTAAETALLRQWLDTLADS
ncbi:TetR/AcrR family transcriptional regulator [Actinacidiphila sp. ITFR-21]|uniref:TetR/AcrR family transcriptional regulator n=1 Tax=Actinacidiphila sp. ITFR-21 TaxID=3075199 RepID=UPI002889E21F|nr:TetR/AcrR family transcriptional regulator [Streptomyces sp. ITFR-21]WNI19454.1 TetR/AcrR family transcriptional regulator [Streptomyces sp. ITFR-21]